ncbi:farnesyl pyrophosphate synthase-like [Biomphalaria glabrata]|uniref:Farnesyl pyrophosphate synthase n=1 Tax=Biomphalaria glabrata TaxID=6526 RepID=A0A9U8E4V4_BIOGL|nr:farnesyl pyrophosphate synthase-like [Biomphalaria glabrata]XP_055900830.1 farnesyl pyrophosphate synthase-like [Biomphalaria glabrata]
MDSCNTESKKMKVSTELSEFDAIFEELVENLTKEGLQDKEIKDAFTWFKEVLIYNVPHGKKNRGISVVTSFKHLVPDASEDDIKIARVMGWCVELLQGFFLVADDIMDNSLTRRGQPCWYKKEGVGMIAINDSYFLESCIYKLIKRYAASKPYYVHLLELFLETTLQTVIGQCMDLITVPVEGKLDLSKFDMERYSTIVKWKTAFYSFYLPVAIAMYMSGITDEVVLAKAKEILLEMGHFFQVQDDYLDCYGDPEVIGKIGTDIQDCKCGWLVVRALEVASEEQKDKLKEYYGKWDDEAVQKVKNIYKELKVESLYLQFEEESYTKITHMINTLDVKLPKSIFHDFVNKIYKRQK